jgi:ABC-type transport system involved in multi-copper enzyme maturation permease subunit
MGRGYPASRAASPGAAENVCPSIARRKAPTSGPPGTVATVAVIARLGLREAVRARALRVLVAVVALLLGIFAVAASQVMDAARRTDGTVTTDVVGATLLGSSAFTALLLGTIVGVLLVAPTVRGDSERGVLQPLAVRPVPRGAIVLGRIVAGGGVATTFAVLLWLATVLVLRWAGDWSPPQVAGPAAALGLAVAIVALGAAAASTVLPSTTAGMVVLALVGVGLSVGLVAQLGAGFGLGALGTIADVVSTVLPFETLYRHVLHLLSSDVGDLAAVGVAVGPFGGAQEATMADFGAIGAWIAVVGTWTLVRSSRLDL